MPDLKTKSDLMRNFNFYNQSAAKYLLRWNRNYFDWLQQYFGDPAEFGDNLKIAWQTGNRKAVYHAAQMIIQLHENPDGDDLKWKLIGVKHYPSEENIKNYAAWMEGKFEIVTVKKEGSFERIQ